MRSIAKELIEKISRRDSDQNLIVDGYEFDKLKKGGARK